MLRLRSRSRQKYAGEGSGRMQTLQVFILALKDKTHVEQLSSYISDGKPHSTPSAHLDDVNRSFESRATKLSEFGKEMEHLMWKIIVEGMIKMGKVIREKA
jgi:hypothetical protein